MKTELNGPLGELSLLPKNGLSLLAAAIDAQRYSTLNGMPAVLPWAAAQCQDDLNNGGGGFLASFRNANLLSKISHVIDQQYLQPSPNKRPRLPPDAAGAAADFVDQFSSVKENFVSSNLTATFPDHHQHHNVIRMPSGANLLMAEKYSPSSSSVSLPILSGLLAPGASPLSHVTSIGDGSVSVATTTTMTGYGHSQCNNGTSSSSSATFNPPAVLRTPKSESMVCPENTGFRLQCPDPTAATSGISYINNNNNNNSGSTYNTTTSPAAPSTPLFQGDARSSSVGPGKNSKQYLRFKLLERQNRLNHNNSNNVSGSTTITNSSLAAVKSSTRLGSDVTTKKFKTAKTNCLAAPNVLSSSSSAFVAACSSASTSTPSSNNMSVKECLSTLSISIRKDADDCKMPPSSSPPPPPPSAAERVESAAAKTPPFASPERESTGRDERRGQGQFDNQKSVETQKPVVQNDLERNVVAKPANHGQFYQQCFVPEVVTYQDYKTSSSAYHHEDTRFTLCRSADCYSITPEKAPHDHHVTSSSLDSFCAAAMRGNVADPLAFVDHECLGQSSSSSRSSGTGSDTERYIERRRRNNEAAKRCRANRRALFDLRSQRSMELERENLDLKQTVKQLRQELHELRSLLTLRAGSFNCGDHVDSSAFRPTTNPMCSNFSNGLLLNASKVQQQTFSTTGPEAVPRNASAPGGSYEASVENTSSDDDESPLDFSKKNMLR